LLIQVYKIKKKFCFYRFSFCLNLEFERATGSDQDRLITTILIDPPFGRNTFIITNRQFIPSILYIAQVEFDSHLQR